MDGDVYSEKIRPKGLMLPYDDEICFGGMSDMSNEPQPLRVSSHCQIATLGVVVLA
jgi:hypothetical protein